MDQKNEISGDATEERRLIRFIVCGILKSDSDYF
jgi:hypothetical protein